MNIKPAILSAALLMATALLGAKNTDRTAQIGTERRALIKAESDFQAARAERGLEGWLSFFADDAADFPPGSAITFTKAAMREHLSKTWNPDITLKWQPVKADVSGSRDLAYTVGTWQLSGKNRKGEPVSMTGKYVTVWKKQSDGSWKVVADMGSAD